MAASYCFFQSHQFRGRRLSRNVTGDRQDSDESKQANGKDHSGTSKVFLTLTQGHCWVQE